MKKIVVLGGGYAGMRAIKKLAHAKLDAEIVLVNKNPYHYESTQLHQLAAGTREVSDITFDVRQVVPKNVKVIIDEVTHIDQKANRVDLKNGGPINYDYLVNCLGFESETFGIKGAEENGLSIVDVNTAEAARDHLEAAFKRYRTSHDENDLHVVVCGAGFTSIEYLGELAFRLPRLAKEYGFPMDKVRLDCIEAAPRILPMFDQKLSNWGVRYLEKRGVVFHTNTPITEVTPNAVMSNDTAYTANTIIWTTGVKGSHIIGDSDYDQKRNRVVVKDDLSIEGHPEEFLIGDVSAVPNPNNGRLYPTTAQISIAQADTAAANVVASINGQPTRKFVFKPLGTVCSLGPNAGIAMVEVFGHWKLKGVLAAIAKVFIADEAVLKLANLKTMLESK
ncbi:NADH dehydrogenase [Bifidobacterium bohemicum]|uniref:Pyridine nucleotide-disulfide oxidoreductase n=1 Tax=Bifidobacterium bohemicum DSM 22767 TaxID=1437606 RepID=A0A086ZKE1_9BIFI|nr:NAD(P)/FAD-dependent oxidoreductase [Bifidobacterium bohemicum]KFI46991.1 pyridine nucleotide-disulfide oxidoreductase [Bifidobacterium bohemicum DSM 22767]SCB87138.1 NADH dehydrogenase [Bifidobacterium bohemicum]